MKHTLSVLVENKPGVLARISGLFARRAFNIHSLAVGTTDRPDISRMTIVVDLPGRPLDQVVKQLDKLINVLEVTELTDNSVERELMLMKVSAQGQERSQVMQFVEVFRAKVVDLDVETMSIEVTGSPDKLHAFEDLVRPFGIVELVKTGRIALERGSGSVQVRQLKTAS